MHHAILRVLVMMIGELDYGNIFIDTIHEKNSRSGNPLNPFPDVGSFFLFVCLFLLSIALMNLLVSKSYQISMALIFERVTLNATICS